MSYYELHITNCLDGYADFLHEKGICTIIKQNIKNDREKILLYLKTHLIMAAKHGKVKLVQEICRILENKETDIIELSEKEVTEILHFSCPESEGLKTTCLNYACLSNNKVIGNQLLSVEKTVHKDEASLLSCLRRNMNKEELLPYLVKTAKSERNEVLDKDKKSNEKSSKWNPGLRIFF